MRLPLALIVAAAGAAGSSCTFNKQGVPPPANQLFYPGAIAVDPGNGQWLYVANSNADLRYNDGTLTVVDLNAAGEDRKVDWPDCPVTTFTSRPALAESARCCRDRLGQNGLHCADRRYG